MPPFEDGSAADPAASGAYFLCFALGYLLGSIPFGVVLTKLAGLGDVRSIGSGNIGATNVLRTGNKGLAALTLALDLLKGTAAVLIAGSFAGQFGAVVAGLGAFVGHLFPIWRCPWPLLARCCWLLPCLAPCSCAHALFIALGTQRKCRNGSWPCACWAADLGHCFRLDDRPPLLPS
jgi:hypothetical protein